MTDCKEAVSKINRALNSISLPFPKLFCVYINTPHVPRSSLYFTHLNYSQLGISLLAFFFLLKKASPDVSLSSLTALSTSALLCQACLGDFTFTANWLSTHSENSGEQLSPVLVLMPGQQAQTTDIKAKSVLPFSYEVAKLVFLILYLQYIHLAMSQTHFINFVTSASDVMNSILLI